jgi:hypothetical protein
MMAGTILIVEDDKKTESLVALYLDREGFQTVIAYDGLQAAQTIIRCPYPDPQRPRRGSGPCLGAGIGSRRLCGKAFRSPGVRCPGKGHSRERLAGDSKKI